MAVVPTNPSRPVQLERIPVEGGRRNLAAWVWPAVGTETDTMVLVHCCGSHGRVWDWFVERLPKTMRVICPELNGHGRSDQMSGSNFLWGTNGEDLAAVCKALNVVNACACGHSAGGHAAAKAASLEKDLFRRLLLLDPIIYSEEHYEQNKDGYPAGSKEAARAADTTKRKSSFSSREDFLERIKSNRMYKKWNKNILADFALHGIKESEDGKYQLCCMPAVEARSYMTEALSDANIRPLLPSVRVPVTVVRAPNPFGPKIGPDVAALFPFGEDVALHKSNHFFPQFFPEDTMQYIEKMFMPISARL